MIDDLTVAPIGVQLANQGNDTGHVGRSHRGSAEHGVRVAGRRAEDVDTRCGQVDGRRSKVGKAGKIVVMVGGRNGEDVVQVEACRVEGHTIVVLTNAKHITVAGSGHENVSRVTRIRDGVVHRLRKLFVASPTVVGNRRSCVDRIVDRIHGVTHRAGATCVQKLHRHELDVPVDPGHPDRIITNRANGACHVCSVVMVVHRVPIVIGEVVTVDIVHVSVAVIVLPVSRHLCRVDPHVGGQILVSVIHARVDHSHDCLTAARRRFPCSRRVNVGIECPSGLTHVVHSP